MADVRCPMCGKPNPADTEVCRYCKARLKPLSTSPKSSTPGANPMPPAKAASSDSDDWLRGLIDPTGGAAESTESSFSESASAVDDSSNWLSRIGQNSQDESLPEAKIQADEPQLTTGEDWLSGLDDQAGSIPSSGGDLSSWLDSLRENEEPNQPPQLNRPISPKSSPVVNSSPSFKTPPARQPEPEKDDDEWLRSLTAQFQDTSLSNQPQSSKSTPPSPTEEPSAATNDLSSWLRGLDGDSPSSVQPTTSSSDDTSDWLNSFGSSASTPSPSEDVPDWMSELQPKQPSGPAMPAAAPSEDVPDWMSELRGPEPKSGATQAAPSEDVPDWMSELQSTQPSGPAMPVAAPSEDVPDWMSELRGPEPKSSAIPAAPSEDVPDWMSELQSTQPSSPAMPVAAPSEDVPDWMSELRGPEPKSGAAQAAPSEDVPDWMSELQSTQPSSPAMPAATPSEDVPDWMSELRGPEPKSSAVPAVPSEDVPDWMSALQSPQPSGPAMPAATPSEDVPDWMSELRGPEPKSGAAQAAPSEDVPDWMSELQSTQPSSPAMPAATPSEDVPDWMSELRGPEPKSGAAQAAPSEDVPDWMSELQSTQPSSPAMPAATPSEDVPDWMSELRGPEPKSSAIPAAPSEDVPDWMSELQSPQPSGPVMPAAAPSEDVPDWMSELRGPEPKSGAAQAAPSEDVPDWMSELQSTQPSGPTMPVANVPVWDDNSQTIPSPSEASDTPDWLRSFQAGHLPLEAESDTRSTSETAPARLDAIPSEQDDLDWAPKFEDTPRPATPVEQRPAAPTEADWLSRFGISNVVEKPTPVASQTPVTPTEADDTPDWLKNFSESIPTPPLPAKEPAAEKADVPDWLRDYQPASSSPTPEQPSKKYADPFQQSAPAQSPTPVQKQAADDGDTPEWLKDFDITPFTDNEPAKPLGLPGNTNLPQLPTPQRSSALEETSEEDAIPADMPDWLANVSGAPGQPAKESDSPFGGEPLPSWMKHQQPVMDDMARPFSDQNISAMESTPFANREIDELLEGVAPEKTQSDETDAEGESEAIEMAQMPTWLQAMRPVESGISNISDISGVDDQRIEKSGPLAGLRGVLPGEEVATRYRKLPSYTNKLQVSEKQHIHARLLEDILVEEKQPKSGAATSMRGSQLIIRLLVAVLLMVLVLAPGLTGLRLPVPTGLPATQVGMNAMFKSINEFSSGGYVLLVADYEAGLNGELKMAAMPVLRHLQPRQPRIVIASTLQIGAVMGEALLREAKITPLVNLGYIGGGTNALKRLMLRDGQNNPTPLKDIAPLPYLNGTLYENKWNHPALAGLKDINSFQRIIVMVDNVENARNWIEQVQPLLDKRTQLVMISSAQAAPLIGTYLESGQIYGLVSGLAGGAAYEQRAGQPTNRPESISNSWTAYQLTLAAIIVLILAGAATAGISTVIRNSKSKRKA